MTLLLDTNVVSELLRKAPNPIVAVWAARDCLENLFFSAVGEAESRYGAAIWAIGHRRETLGGYFGEVEQRFRGSGTRIPAKRNARRSVATLLSQFPRIGVAADLRDPTRDLVFESTDESACGACGRRVRRPKGVGNAPSLTTQLC